jgi:hypothetical protein
MNVTFGSCAFRIFDWERYDRNCLINWPSWRRKRLTALLCFQAKLASFASFMRWRTFYPHFVHLPVRKFHRLALYRITPHLKTLRDFWELMSLVSGEKSVKCTRWIFQECRERSKNTLIFGSKCGSMWRHLYTFLELQALGQLLAVSRPLLPFPFPYHPGSQSKASPSLKPTRLASAPANLGGEDPNLWASYRWLLEVSLKTLRRWEGGSVGWGRGGCQEVHTVFNHV